MRKCELKQVILIVGLLKMLCFVFLLISTGQIRSFTSAFYNPVTDLGVKFLDDRSGNTALTLFMVVEVLILLSTIFTVKSNPGRSQKLLYGFILIGVGLPGSMNAAYRQIRFVLSGMKDIQKLCKKGDDYEKFYLKNEPNLLPLTKKIMNLDKAY